MLPGVYDISNEQYHSGLGISRSAIMEWKRSPRHYWHKYINPNYKKPQATTSMLFGTAMHTALLETDEFFKRYVIRPEEKVTIGKPLRLKDVGREKFEEDKKRISDLQVRKKEEEEKFEIESNGKMILTFDEHDQINNMMKAISENQNANDLVINGKYEKSIYWIDPDTDLLCKCRPDIWHEEFIVDYKSCVDASPRAFQFALRDGGFHIQMAMIQEGLKHALDIDMENFIFLAQEKTEPYIPAIYQLDPSALEKGLNEFKEVLFQMKASFETGYYPGYEPQMISI